MARRLLPVLAAVWVLAAVGLFVRANGVPAGPERTNAYILAVVPLLFAGWNLVRWRQTAPRRPAALPRRRPPTGEYHPEFDFGPASGRPSTPPASGPATPAD